MGVFGSLLNGGKDRERLDKKYPYELKMRFHSKDQLELFTVAWLDGGLDQMCLASTEYLKGEKQTWRWTNPALYVEIDDPEQEA